MNHHTTKLDGDRQSGSGDIMALVCQMISQDHMTEGFCNFMSRSPSLVAIDALVLATK